MERLISNSRRIGSALAVLAFLFSPAALYAQSCAMCYQNAAASGPRLITALKHGILVLLFPPLLIFAGILGLAISRRNSFASDEQPELDSGAPPIESSDVEIPLYD